MGNAPIPERELRHLLEHEEWIRRLARSLVADENRVNELIQHVLTEALKNKPRNPKPWITVVMRAAVWRMRRSESRRKFRENAVAREEMQIPGIPQADQRETRERLVSLVQQLEPAYREVLLQHFFEDLTLEEIARRKGVPSATMRTRLRRALTQLREKLRANYGDPGRWVFALLPLSGIRSLSEIAHASAAGKVHAAAGVTTKAGAGKTFFGATAALLVAGSAVGVLALGSSGEANSNPGSQALRSAGTALPAAREAVAMAGSKDPDANFVSAQQASAAGTTGESLLVDSAAQSATPATIEAQLVPPSAETAPDSGIFEVLKDGSVVGSPGSEAVSIDQATGGMGKKGKGQATTIDNGALLSGKHGKAKGNSKKGKNPPQ